MKHISTKNDWYYELRPLLIQAIGAFGVFWSHFSNPSLYSKLSIFCGAILLGLGFIITKWRKTYRAKSFMRT